jgi:hypothetical protein
MKAQELLADLAYVGQVEGLRQTYDVFQGKRHFLVFSFSRSKRGSGNFNIVRADDVEEARKAFSGQHGVTSKALKARLKRAGRSTEALEALNILYVLVARSDARIDRRRSQREILFDIGSR